MGDYAITNLNDIDDLAADAGFGELQEARFPRDAIGLESSGIGHLVVKPGKRQPFAHRHAQAEEVYVVMRGNGRVKLDDEVVEVRERDLVRVAPHVVRMFEAGSEGLELLAFGPRHEGDAEIVQDFWS